MPSCDVILHSASSCSKAPPLARRTTLLPAAAFLTLCSSKKGGSNPASTPEESAKRPLIKCIVKVLKRAKTHEDNCDIRVAKKPREEIEEVKDSVSEERQVIVKQPIMISRTNLKQQLMREQMQQQEKRERDISCSAPTQSSNVNWVPVPLQVPKTVLMVRSKLENPTPYHVRESQQRQVREFLSQSSLNGRTRSLPTSRLVNSVDPSPTSDFSAAVSSTTSPNELEDLLNDIQSLDNSCTDSVADDLLDPSFTVDLTGVQAAEVDFLENLFLLPAVDPVSTSCPAGLADLAEEGEDKVRAFQKDRQKKDNHNRIEKRRRFNINDRIKELGTLLPRSNDPHYDLVKDLRQNKGTILKASVDYVRCLKKEVQKVPDLELRLRMVEQNNKKLLLRIQAEQRNSLKAEEINRRIENFSKKFDPNNRCSNDLELQLRANNIPVNESTWVPSTPADLNAIIKEESISSPPLSNGSSCHDKYFPSSQPNLPTLPEHYAEYQNYDMSALPHSEPNCGGARKRLPIMQFLVKKESQSHASSSCSQSPATYCASPAPSYSAYEDLMMEDDQDHPVTGDPMFSVRDTFTPENMDFMS